MKYRSVVVAAIVVCLGFGAVGCGGQAPTSTGSDEVSNNPVPASSSSVTPGISPTTSADSRTASGQQDRLSSAELTKRLLKIEAKGEKLKPVLPAALRKLLAKTQSDAKAFDSLEFTPDSCKEVMLGDMSRADPAADLGMVRIGRLAVGVVQAPDKESAHAQLALSREHLKLCHKVTMAGPGGVVAISIDSSTPRVDGLEDVYTKALTLSGAGLNQSELGVTARTGSLIVEVLDPEGRASVDELLSLLEQAGKALTQR